MFDKVLSFIAPHYCCGCDKIGSLLCDNCKYNIISEQSPRCLGCKRPTAGMWLCQECTLPYQKAWAVGEREGTLQRLIGLYKFERATEGHKILGDLLSSALPQLPIDTIVVPIPTPESRVRERGYDHMLLITKHFAKIRGLECEQVLKRVGNTKQRHHSASQRLAQAKNAFFVNKKLNDNKIYLIIDDVVTTGATLKYAAKTLRKAGAKDVWVAVIAQQISK